MNMLATHTFDAATMPQWLAEQLTDLCHESSEMQHQLQCIVDGDRHLLPSEWRVCTASVGDVFEMKAIGWVSASIWNFMQQLQGYVHENYRNRRLATSLAGLLLLGDTMRGNPLAVFSDEFRRIGVALGYTDVRQYRAVDDGWIRVEFADRRPDGNDEAGLHAPARQVCDMPLADEAAGEVA